MSMEKCASISTQEEGATEAKLQFEKHVASQFRGLIKRGFHPNRAAAYALKLASKTGVQDDCAARTTCSALLRHRHLRDTILCLLICWRVLVMCAWIAEELVQTGGTCNISFGG